MKRIISYGLSLTLLIALVLILSACTSSSPTPSQSATISPTATPTPSASPTISPTPSVSPSHTTPTPTPTITNTSLQDGELGMPYSENLQASGGSGTYTWSISSDFLPLGLSLDPKTGTISGTPTAPATYFFGVMVMDKTGTSSYKVYSITIVLSPSATPPPIPSPTVTTPATPNPTATETPVQFAITTNGLPDSGVGISYSQGLQTVGGTPPFQWSYWNGPLPDGLFLDAATGIIFGQPTKAGTFNFTVEVTDSTGAIAGRAFTLHING